MNVSLIGLFVQYMLYEHQESNQVESVFLYTKLLLLFVTMFLLRKREHMVDYDKNMNYYLEQNSTRNTISWESRSGNYVDKQWRTVE